MLRYILAIFFHLAFAICSPSFTLVEICQANSTTNYDSDITVAYSDSDGPVFVFDISSDDEDQEPTN